MCKFSPKSGLKRIDPCMVHLISFIEATKTYKPLASCCGHGKYPMTIVVRDYRTNHAWDIVSNVAIPRKKKLYKKDKQGYYYIPEVVDYWKRKGK